MRPADLERVLTNQQRRGDERLLSMLVGEGLLDADAGARVLAKQHGVPAALQKHIDGRDGVLAALLTPVLAHEYTAIPIAKTRDGALVVCLVDPTRVGVIPALEHATRHKVIAAVACARVVRQAILASYGEVEGDDFDVQMTTGQHEMPAGIRTDAKGAASPLPAAEPEFTLAMLDEEGVARDFSQQQILVGSNSGAATATELITQIAVGRAMTNSGVAAPTAADAAHARSGAYPMAPPSANASGKFPRAATTPAAVAPVPHTAGPESAAGSGRMATAPAPAVAGRAATAGHVDASPRASGAFPAVGDPGVPLTLAQLTQRLAVAPTRDGVTDAAFAYLASHWHSALMCTIKDGVALGHRGFGGNATPAAVDALAIPLSAASIFKQVFDSRRTETCASTGVIQDRISRMMGSDKMTAAPVLVAGRMMGALAVGVARSAQARQEFEQAVALVGEHYARIIRAAKG